MWRLFELNYNDFSLNLSEKFPSRYMIANCHILKSHFCTSLNFEIVSVLITLLRITGVIMRDPCHFNQDVRHKNAHLKKPILHHKMAVVRFSLSICVYYNSGW